MCVTDEKMDQRAAYMFLDKVKCYVKQDSSTLIIIKINFYKYTRQYYIVILKCQWNEKKKFRNWNWGKQKIIYHASKDFNLDKRNKKHQLSNKV